MVELNDSGKSQKHIGLGVALGAGLGIVFGEAFFGDVGIGLALGVGIGVALGAASSKRSKKKDGMDENSN